MISIQKIIKTHLWTLGLIFSLAENSYGQTCEGYCLPQENGWTILSAGNDAQTIYVSSSLGSDSYTGLCPSVSTGNCGPKQSIGAGLALLRNGYGDHLLLRRGDEWTDNVFLANRSGGSFNNPFVVSSYGESTTRPLIRGGFGSTGTVNYAVVSGLAFTSAVGVSHGGDGFLIEDCYIQGHQYGLLYLQPIYTSVSASHWSTRRNVLDASNSGFTPTMIFQGLSTENQSLTLNNSLIEENILYSKIQPGRNGGAYKAMYLGSSLGRVSNVTVRGNLISLFDIAGGIMQRPGGVTEDNFIQHFTAAPIGLAENDDCGGCSNLTLPPTPGIIRNNVALKPLSGTWGGFLFGSRPLQDGSRLSGNILNGGVEGCVGCVGLNTGNQPTRDFVMKDNISYNYGQIRTLGNAINLVVENNEIQNPSLPGVLFSDAAGAMDFLVNNGFVARNNKWWSGVQAPNALFNIQPYFAYEHASLLDWQQVTAANTDQVLQLSYLDPLRDVASYNALLGGTASEDAFFARAVLQSKLNWDERYTAYKLNDYIRCGFNKAPLHGSCPGSQTQNVCSKADVDGDGLYTANDYTAFQNSFMQGNMATGDVDGNGMLNINDYIAFNSTFAACSTSSKVIQTRKQGLPYRSHR